MMCSRCSRCRARWAPVNVGVGVGVGAEVKRCRGAEVQRGEVQRGRHAFAEVRGAELFWFTDAEVHSRC
jgi:hypothetical protein